MTKEEVGKRLVEALAVAHVAETENAAVVGFVL
jgi:hypothetical protein